MTKFKLSSRMHILIIISSLIIAVGLAMGLVFEFVSDGYFNYGGEYASYKSVVVNYAYVDLSAFGDEEGIQEICDAEFKSAGVNYYSSVRGETSGGGEITFKFNKNTSEENLRKASDAVNAKLTDAKLSGLSNASFHDSVTVKDNVKAYTYGAIALASAIVFQLIYFVVRYGISMALASLLADLHNFAIFVSLTAITRVPVGSSVAVFAVLTVLMTMIGCALFFDKMRKAVKDENFVKLEVNEQVDRTVYESLQGICLPAIFVAAASVILFVLLSVSAMSVTLVITSAVLGLLSAVSAVYGTAFFTPAVYSRFKLIEDNCKAGRTKKASKKS